MGLAMSVEEREEFLAGVHVAVLAVERSDGPPLAVPVWYDYRPGGQLWILTPEDSVKGRLLQAAALELGEAIGTLTAKAGSITSSASGRSGS